MCKIRTDKPEKKEADLAGPATTNGTDELYPKTSSRSSGLPKFSDAVKRRWKVRRDAGGQDYIVLNGRSALGKGGLDHIYLISEVRVGAWLTSPRIASKVNKLQKLIGGLRIEQFGDGEAVVSVGIEQIDDLCRAVNARKRRTVSDKERQRLRRISPIAKRQKSLTKSNVRKPKITKSSKGV